MEMICHQDLQKETFFLSFQKDASTQQLNSRKYFKGQVRCRINLAGCHRDISECLQGSDHRPCCLLGHCLHQRFPLEESTLRTWEGMSPPTLPLSREECEWLAGLTWLLKKFNDCCVVSEALWQRWESKKGRSFYWSDNPLVSADLMRYLSDLRHLIYALYE